jgi:hypothetical protein
MQRKTFGQTEASVADIVLTSPGPTVGGISHDGVKSRHGSDHLVRISFATLAANACI